MRAKFRVESVTDYGNNKTANLSAVTDTTTENNSFWKFTPWADLKINISNPDLQDYFIPGNEYYLDFSPVVK